MTAGEAVSQGSRTRARRLVMQALYQWQLSGEPWDQIYAQYEDTESARGADFEYFRSVLNLVVKQRDELDKELARVLDRPPEQLDPIERAILWLGVFELADRPDVPYRVVINEAVELAKRYGATGSHRYVNGVLDKCAAALRGSEFKTGRTSS